MTGTVSATRTVIVTGIATGTAKTGTRTGTVVAAVESPEKNPAAIATTDAIATRTTPGMNVKTAMSVKTGIMKIGSGVRMLITCRPHHQQPTEGPPRGGQVQEHRKRQSPCRWRSC